MRGNKATGMIAVLSWPDTYVSGTGAIYEPIFKKIGLAKSGKYKAGHSALMLINRASGLIEFFDFGRYITPKGKGRVRGPLTDPEMRIPIKARFDTNANLINPNEILHWLAENGQVTHGAGRLVASFCGQIDYNKARAFILLQQGRGSIQYGPFYPIATNCSRFVADVLKNGASERWLRVKNTYRITGTPSPLGNVLNSTTDKKIYRVMDGRIDYLPAKRVTFLRDILGGFIEKAPHLLGDPVSELGTVLEPERHPILNNTATWLGGVGAGAWFQHCRADHLDNCQFVFQRVAANGNIDFTRIYESSFAGFDSNAPFEFIYDSNALYCTILQKGKICKFDFVEEIVLSSQSSLSVSYSF